MTNTLNTLDPVTAPIVVMINGVRYGLPAHASLHFHQPNGAWIDVDFGAHSATDYVHIKAVAPEAHGPVLRVTPHATDEVTVGVDLASK